MTSFSNVFISKTVQLKQVLNTFFESIFSKTGPDVDPTLASHPVHLINNKDNPILPSALVPFCAFNSNLSISTPLTFLPKEEFPICTSFLPTSLDGQRCYKLNLNRTSWEGRRNGLVLLLDMNEERLVNHIRKENGHGQNVDRTIIGLSAKLTHLSSIFVRPLLRVRLRLNKGGGGSGRP